MMGQGIAVPPSPSDAAGQSVNVAQGWARKTVAAAGFPVP